MPRFHHIKNCQTGETGRVQYSQQEEEDADTMAQQVVADEAATAKAENAKADALARLVEKSKTDENARDYLLAIGKTPHADAVEVPK